MTWFVCFFPVRRCLRFVGQSDFDALLRILSEFEGFDARHHMLDTVFPRVDPSRPVRSGLVP